MSSIPYILVLVYFLGLVAICTLVLSRHDSSRTIQQAKQAQQSKQKIASALMKNAVSYGFLTALFAFFLVLTVVLQHDTSKNK